MRQKVDKIVIDAPCSGTGTFRRNPDAKWKVKEEDFEKCHYDQVSIIEKAIPYLKPGGSLWYITCSVEPAENEKVMEEVFQKHPELIQSKIGGGDFYFRLWPHRDGTDGFFLAGADKK